jgi:hypothetical protein
MSTAVAAVQADARDPFETTRENYQRFAMLLVRVGRVPELTLSHLDFRVLLFLLGQKPGHYAAHHRTIAAACDSNATSIKDSLGRLRKAGLVLSELVRPHHRLPSGRYSRTNVNRYWVHLPRLASLLETPVAIGRKSDSSMRRNSASSHGTTSLNEQPPPLSPPQGEPEPVSESLASESEAISKTESQRSEITPICEAWMKLGLGEIDGRSKRALENRIADGATHEQLEAAVEGASADDWLRRRAKVPFAVVFASLSSIERFAHAGRKLRDAREHATKREAEERRRELEWRKGQQAALRAPDVTDAERHELDVLFTGQSIPPAPRLRAESLTPEEFARRRVEQRARALAWAKENGLDDDA